MHQRAAEIEAILTAGDRRADEIRRDTRYSETYRDEQAREILATARREANKAAREALDGAEARFKAASDRVIKERSAWHDQQDPTRHLVAIRRADALASRATVFAEVEATVREASENGDLAMLSALAEVGLPALRERARGEMSPMRGNRGQIETLLSRVKERIAELEPDSLKAARVELTAAERDAADIRRDVESINWRSTLSRGGWGVLSDALKPAATVTYHPSGAVKSMSREW
jgi:exonuclease VII large subunit